MIPHLAATLIWAGFSLSPGAIEVVFTTRAGRLRTWVGGDLAPLWAHSIEWLVWWSTLFPIQWPGPICPLVSEATGRIFASMLLFFQFNLQLSSLSKETVYATCLLTEAYMTCPLDPPQAHPKRFNPSAPSSPKLLSVYQSKALSQLPSGQA